MRDGEEEEVWMVGRNRRDHPAVWKASQLATKAGIQLRRSRHEQGQDSEQGTMRGRNRRHGEQHLVWKASQVVGSCVIDFQ